MIIPDKYIKPSESIMFISTYIIKKIRMRKYSIIDLWLELKKEKVMNMNYNRFCQVLVYLYIIGYITYTKEGELFNENIES